MLDRRMRRSWPARVTAVGFIIVIIFGNLWLVHAMTGSMTPEWIEGGFGLGLGLAILGGVGLAALAVVRSWSGDTTDDDDENADGDNAATPPRDEPPSVGT